jgi:hypothetical protein
LSNAETFRTKGDHLDAMDNNALQRLPDRFSLVL